MPALKGTKTHDNLKHAFAAESQANRRYLYFARRADIEGYPDVGGLFRDTAEAETGHAFGHLDFLKEVGDPATGFAIGNTDANLRRSRIVFLGQEQKYAWLYQRLWAAVQVCNEDLADTPLRLMMVFSCVSQAVAKAEAQIPAEQWARRAEATATPQPIVQAEAAQR